MDVGLPGQGEGRWLGQAVPPHTPSPKALPEMEHQHGHDGATAAWIRGPLRCGGAPPVTSLHSEESNIKTKRPCKMPPLCTKPEKLPKAIL